MIIKIENDAPVGHPITEENFRYLFPDRALPLVLSADIVEPLGYGMYDFSQIPNVAWDQKLVEATPVKNEHSIWRQTWTVVDLAGDELAAAAEAEQARKIATFDRALTGHLDATARLKRYDDRISCMVRAGFTGPFQAEGQAFAAWCDACNVTAYTLLAEVQAGTRPLPETTQALIDMLPVMVWPA
jgi:hypothetical protein